MSIELLQRGDLGYDTALSSLGKLTAETQARVSRRRPWRPPGRASARASRHRRACIQVQESRMTLEEKRADLLEAKAAQLESEVLKLRDQHQHAVRQREDGAAMESTLKEDLVSQGRLHSLLEQRKNLAASAMGSDEDDDLDSRADHWRHEVRALPACPARSPGSSRLDALLVEQVAAMKLRVEQVGEAIQEEKNKRASSALYQLRHSDSHFGNYCTKLESVLEPYQQARAANPAGGLSEKDEADVLQNVREVFGVLCDDPESGEPGLWSLAVDEINRLAPFGHDAIMSVLKPPARDDDSASDVSMDEHEDRSVCSGYASSTPSHARSAAPAPLGILAANISAAATSWHGVVAANVAQACAEEESAGVADPA